MLETMGHQSRLLAQDFNDSKLGANAGKKYISCLSVFPFIKSKSIF